MVVENYAIYQLAWETVRLAREPASREVLHQAERCVLDVLGCALAGKDDPAVAAVHIVAGRRFSGKQALRWFSGEWFGTIGAAYVNSIASTILDLDDGNRQAMGHPGGAVIPAALALAQELGSSRETLLRAIVAGYELAVRVGAAERRPSYHSGNYTSFGVAAAAGVLYELDADQLAHAFGICAYHGPRLSDLTLSREMGSNVKESMAWSVVAGLMSCELAGAGFTGNRDALDIEERVDRARLLADLGGEPAIMRTYFKKYSCCRWIHSAVEALLCLMNEHGLSAGDIDSVQVETFLQAASLNNRTAPPSLESAQYSVPYCMGLVAVHGEACLTPISEAMLGDADATAFARKIEVFDSDRMNALFPGQVPAAVTVTARGETYERRVAAPWGEASRPPEDAELMAKFRLIASSRLPAGSFDEIENLLFSDDSDLAPLFSYIEQAMVPETTRTRGVGLLASPVAAS